MKEKVVQLEKLLAVKQFRIQSLLEVTKAVNNNFSKAALLRIFEFVLRAQLHVGKVTLFLLEEKWEVVLNIGNQNVVEKIDIEEDLMKFQVLQKVTNFPGGKFEGFDYMLPIVHKKFPIAYVLIGDITLDEIDSVDDKLKFIETISNFILVSLENKRLIQKQLAQERVNKEIELAVQVQNMLIPKNLPCNEIFEAAGYYRPHGSIGGDYYDFIEIDDTHVAFCMCDVSGKGVGAGMIMANFQANLRALVNKDYPIDQLIDHLNFKLKQTTKGDKFITMFLGIYNTQNRKLQYVNAGHNPPLLLSGNDAKLLKDGSTILGVFDTLPMLHPQEIVLDENALILTYTDGVTELENEIGEMFEMDRLVDFSLKNQNCSTEEFNTKLMTLLESFKGEMDYNDDISILTCRFY